MQSMQSRYFTNDRELLATFEAIAHFCDILEGRKFTVFTDHKHGDSHVQVTENDESKHASD